MLTNTTALFVVSWSARFYSWT